MLPAHDVGLFVSRVAYANPTTVENLRAMEDDIAHAASLILPESGLDVLAFQCVSGTIAIGPERVLALMETARPGGRSTTTIHAVVAGLRALRATRISLLTPYVDEVTELVAGYLVGSGIDVVAAASFKLGSDVEMARVPTPAIHEAALRVNLPEAEAIYISCGALNATPVIHALEQKLEKPVVSSNQALCWHALQLIEYDAPLEGFGRLMGVRHSAVEPIAQNPTERDRKRRLK
jgi:maleate isomerase